MILSKSKITKGSRFEDLHLLYNVNKYRAKAIVEMYRSTGLINPSWVQDFGVVNFTKVKSVDDPAITNADCLYGKYTVPSIVGLEGDKGVYRVASADKTKKYYPLSFDRFMSLQKDTTRANWNYFTRVGNAIYVHPYIPQGNMQLIIDDPFQGFSINTENVVSGELTIGDSFTVISGSVTHNSIKYISGQSFTAVSATFTGSGIVQYTNKKRAMRLTDQYPMDHSLTEFVVMNLLTKEFAIEAKEVADIRNDSQDQGVRIQQPKQ